MHDIGDLLDGVGRRVGFLELLLIGFQQAALVAQHQDGDGEEEHPDHVEEDAGDPSQSRAGGNGEHLPGAPRIENDGQEAAAQQDEDLEQHARDAAQRNDHEHPDDDGGDKTGPHGMGVVKADFGSGFQGRGGGGDGAQIIGGMLDTRRTVTFEGIFQRRRRIGKLRLSATVTKAGVGGQLGAASTEIGHEFSVSQMSRVTLETMSSTTLLVVSNPSAPYLKWLRELPSDVNYVVGNTVDTLSGLGEHADAILYCMGPGISLKTVWGLAPRVQWIHTLSAGLESVLFPELADSTVPLTNGRGVFKESLGEFVVAAILHFAKDLRRMVRSQEAARWDQFDVEMVSGKTLGVIGYGEIGRAAAVRAHALGMKIHVIRRRPQLSEEDPIVEKSFTTAQRGDMIAGCDYLLVAAPLTGETRGLVGPEEFRRMKPSMVIMNVGRGPVIDEPSMIKALSEGTIKGAGLDVFDVEPLPAGHPFWGLSNVLISPHCADHTATWTDEAMQFFLENLKRYQEGQPLQNLVDKKSGY